MRITIRKKLILLLTVCVFAVAGAILLRMECLSASAKNEFEIDYIPIQSVCVYSESTVIRQGEEVLLGVDLQPVDAEKTVQNVEYRIIAGFTYASIDGNVLKVNSNAKVGAVITVKAVADGVTSENSILFTVGAVPVEKITITNTQSSISQGETLQLLCEIAPADATVKQLIYTISDGIRYASVSSAGLIRVSGKLPAGNLSITVTAMSKDSTQIVAVRTFNLYVPTATLNLSHSGNALPGEAVTLERICSANATEVAPEYEIVSGEEYVRNLNGNVLEIEEDIADFNPKIVVRTCRDGLSAEHVIDIFVPAKSIGVTTEKSMVKQGEMLELKVTVNPANATLNGLRYFIAEGDEKYARVTVDGIFAALVNPDVEIITVNVYAKLGDLISEALNIVIEKPSIILWADNCSPCCGDSVSLCTVFDGKIQSSGYQILVKSGGEFIEEISPNGVLTVVESIDVIKPQIVLATKVSEYISGDILISIKIPVTQIEIDNEYITEVEQQRIYSFKGHSLPLNADSVAEKLVYSIDCNSGIAEIYGNGVLRISSTAPVGSVININISGPDGVTKVHSVSVKTVYAESIRISEVTDSDGKLVSDGDSVLPGTVLDFTAEFTQPFNVTESQKNYSLEIIEGDTDVAVINGHSVIVNSKIDKRTPAFVVRVSSDQNESVIFEDFKVKVYVPVESVAITQHIYSVNENSRMDIRELLSASVYPANADLTDISYEIVSGKAYAYIDGEQVVVSGGLKSGSLSFTLRAYADGVASGQAVFEIYVKTENLSVTASNTNPASRIYSGETITLSSQVDEKATANNPIITIDSGAEYIDGNYKNGGLLGRSFKIKKNLTATRSAETMVIRLKAEQDGIVVSLTPIVIYVPVEKISLNLPSKVDRGGMLTVRPIFNGVTNAYVTNAAGDFRVEGPAERVSNGNTIKINQNAVAGSVITIKYISSDVDAVECVQRIQVNGLNNSFNAAYFNTANFSESFTIRYGQAIKGDKSVDITENMQVEEGGYTYVTVIYNGQPLSYYGISNCEIEFEVGKDCVICKEISLGYFQISVNGGTSGTQIIKFRFNVKDGAQNYRSDLQAVNVFKKFTEQSLKNCYISDKETQLETFGGEGASKFSEIKFTSSSGFGFTLTPEGKFVVTSSSATYDPVVKYTAKQIYNGLSYTVEGQATLSLPYNRIEKNGGTGGQNYVINIPGVRDKIKNDFKKTGYLFNGVGDGYAQKYGSDGTKTEDINGNATLYVDWKPITYIVIIHRYYDGKHREGEVKRYYMTYNAGQSISAPGLSGYHFEKWQGCNFDFYNTNSTFTTNLTVEQDKELHLDAYYGKDSSCVADGTLITLADGTQKAVEELDGSELLLVWNLHTGEFDASPILFIDSHGVKEYEVIKLYFDDGTVVDVIEEHGFWDCDINEYVFLRYDADKFIGHSFSKYVSEEDGVMRREKARLVNVEIAVETTNAWSPVTFGNLCYYVNGMLSMPSDTQSFINIFEVDGETMRIDAEKFEADIEKYGLYTYEEINAILPVPEIVFEAFGGQYLKVAIGKGLTTLTELANLFTMYQSYFE